MWAAKGTPPYTVYYWQADAVQGQASAVSVTRQVLRPIFITKTKIKTKMIPFRFIKTKTKTISFQKTK